MKKLIFMVMLIFTVVSVGGNAWSDDTALNEGIRFSIMQPDPATRHEWLDQFAFMEEAYIDERLASSILESGQNGEYTSFSLLSKLKYTPSERNQGSCGDCWVWSGTGIMEIDLNINKSINDRLSTQLFNSCRSPYACCGGNLNSFASWYSGQKKAVPWSNTNASFQDASKTCSGSSGVSCSSISTSPNYPITSISATQISTQSVSQSTAIANIKNVLHQNKGVEFAFWLANDTDWNAFYSFWGSQSESTVWDPDSYCGHTWNDSQGGGHAVLIVGYDDSASTPYWIVLNSWGTASGNRPSGLFRMKMNMNYGCTMYEAGYGSWYSRQFSTLNMQWGTTSSYQITSPTPGSVLTSTTPTFQWTAGGAEYWLYIGSSVGSANYYNSGSMGTATSKTVSGLPSNGSTVYVRFYYRATSSSSWAFKDYTYTAVNTGGSFAITSPVPGTTLTSTSPTFQWTAGGAEYWLYIGSGVGSANYYNSGSLGTATSKTVSGLPSNGSTVYVRFYYRATSGSSWAYNDYTYTAMSGGGGGFNSQFNGSAPNWLQDAGSWSISGSMYWYTAGRAYYSNASTYNQNYSNLDYSAKLWRSGIDSNANRIIIRASGSIMSDGYFSNGYLFQYTRDGYYSVFKYVAGTYSAIKGWASSSAIVQGSAWNTLRVKAVGSSFYFYINDTLVWSGTDSSLSSGRVGMGMYQNTTSTGNGLWADWAVLTIPSSLAVDNEFESNVCDDVQSISVPGDINGTFK